MKNPSKKRPTFLFKKVVHKKEERLLLLFPYEYKIISKIRNLKLFLWSKTLKGWHSEFDLKHLKLIESTLGDEVDFKYDTSLSSKTKLTRTISEPNKNVIRSFIKFLQGRRYSESTVKTYFSLIADFVEYVNEIPLKNVSHKDVDRYLGEVFAPKGYSISTQRQFISAIKLFVEFYSDIKIDPIKLVRPKKSKILPSVLSFEEIIALLQHTPNLKHRAIIAMIYSAGLRISELINLRLEHIDIARRQLFIKNSKGRKDRVSYLQIVCYH